MVFPIVIGAVVAGGFIGAWIIDSLAAAFGISQNAAAQMSTAQAITQLQAAGNSNAATALSVASQNYSNSSAGGALDINSLLPMILIIAVVGMVKK